MKIYQQVKNSVEKRRYCSYGAISPLFHNIFNIPLTSWVQLHIYLLNVVVRIIFSSILQIWYVEVRISGSISESPLEFEITRVDCICLVRFEAFLLIHKSLRLTNKPQIKPIMKQRWRLNRNNVLSHMEILWMSNNTTGILEQKQNRKLNPDGRETDIKSAGPDDLK